jgi:hypothetical protein
MGEIAPEDEDYKDDLIEKALYQGKKKIAEIPKKAGIHVYFFIHGTKFLKEGGTFGFIVNNSWLDVDYGKGLQEFLLKNHKIVAVIESKVERWFEDADVNTGIIILEKCSNKKEKDENLVRFVYLKKKLSDFIPPADDIWGQQVDRLNEIKKLKRTILGHDELYENDEMRIFPKSQKELWEEGYDEEEGKYIGGKWGKYLIAPDIFFKVMTKGKGTLVPLKSEAHIQFGIKTGANEFFYLTEDDIKKRKIEKEYWMHKEESGNWIPNYVFRSPQEAEHIVVSRDDLNKMVLLIEKEKKALKPGMKNFIRYGERQGYDQRKTCSNRNPWYSFDDKKSRLFWIKDARQRLVVFYSQEELFCDCRLYPITTQEPLLIGAILNSTLEIFLAEFIGRQLGGGGGPRDVMTYEVKQLMVPSIKSIKKNTMKNIENAFKKFMENKIPTIFEDIGAQTAEEVTLDKVNTDRRELDKIVMGDILGLSDDEQLEVYRAVIDLVKSRIDKAKSFGKKTKTASGIDVDALKKVVVKRIDGMDE